MLGGVRFRKWAEVGQVAFQHFSGFFYSKKRDDCDLPFFNIHHPDDDLVWCFAFDSRTPDGPPSCVWHFGNNRERVSRHSRLTLWLCPFQGIHQLTFSLIFQRWSVTGTTTKFLDPVALKGTVMERNARDTVSSFCFFLPVLLRAPNRGQTHFAAEIGNVSPHSRAHLWVCFRSLNSKIAFYQGSHYTLDVTVPIKTCWLCGWQTELVYHTHSVATS